MLNIADISIEKLRDGELENELPEFYELKNVFENNLWHHETTFEHVLLVLDEYEKFTSNHQIIFLNEKVGNHLKFDLLKIAILLHDISKIDTLQIAEDKTTSFPGHEEHGSTKALNILGRFVLAESEINFITAVIGGHGKPHKILGSREDCDQMLDDLKTEIADVYNETLLLAMIDTMGSKLKHNNEEEYNFRIGKYKEILKLN